MAPDALDVLLIEDNPGDARLIEEMLGDAERLLERVATDDQQLHHETRLSDGLDRLEETDIDVILLDLGLPASTGLDTLATMAEATEFVPIVVLTGLRDESVGTEAVQRGAQDYLVKGEVTSELLVRSIHHAVDRNEQERKRARQLEQLRALNNLNRVTQEITHAVITTSTQEELERAVCERLADADAYRFAWIGAVDHGTNRVTPEVAAGVEDGYLDEIEVTVGDDETAQGPSGRAVQTHEVQVMQDAQADSTFEPWREQAIERDYRSSAAVPVAYESHLYRVLNIYAASPNAFSAPEIEMLSRLGDVIGHAFAAIERKDALVSDQVLELTFGVEDIAAELLALPAERMPAVEFESLIRNDGSLVAYGQSDGIDAETFQEAVVEADGTDDLRILSAEDEVVEFELVTPAIGDLANAVATHGGHVTSASIDDGRFRFVVEFPPGRDKRRLIERVKEQAPDASVLAQRKVQQTDTGVSAGRSAVEERLTEKQRSALEAAYSGGYFGWPRESSAQDLADSFDITPSTFTQHFRTAERKVFDAMFDDGPQSDASVEGEPEAK
jgi:CheY-like chemotaxis protein